MIAKCGGLEFDSNVFEEGSNGEIKLKSGIGGGSSSGGAGGLFIDQTILMSNQYTQETFDGEFGEGVYAGITESFKSLVGADKPLIICLLKYNDYTTNLLSELTKTNEIGTMPVIGRITEDGDCSYTHIDVISKQEDVPCAFALSEGKFGFFGEDSSSKDNSFLIAIPRTSWSDILSAM